MQTHPTRRTAADMVASDLMTAHVTTVAAGATVQQAAQLLADSLVGGLPVLDAAGAPAGMVSDGDLLGRRTEAARRDWWLKLLATDGAAAPPAAARDRLVQDVMTTPLISVGPYTPVREVVRLLQVNRIKRLPVILDGKIIGLVSRTDLLALVEHLPKTPAEQAGTTGGLYGLLQSLVAGAHAGAAAPAAPADAAPDLSADSFRGLVIASEQGKADEEAAVKRIKSLEQQREIKTVLEQRVTNEFWQQLLQHAELAAQHGDREMLLLRFPSAVCSDGGRTINVVEEGWEKTLRGEAAEIYARWESELKPKGFALSVRSMSFEKEAIGDFGLFLTWNG